MNDYERIHWPNRETHRAALHIQETAHEHWAAVARLEVTQRLHKGSEGLRSAIVHVAEAMAQKFRKPPDAEHPLYADLFRMTISRIDWYAIARRCTCRVWLELGGDCEDERTIRKQEDFDYGKERRWRNNEVGAIADWMDAKFHHLRSLHQDLCEAIDRNNKDADGNTLKVIIEMVPRVKRAMKALASGPGTIWSDDHAIMAISETDWFEVTEYLVIDTWLYSNGSPRLVSVDT